MGILGWRRAGVAACVAGLLVSSGAGGGAAGAVPGPDLELEWEVGHSTQVWDGDTIQVAIDRTSSPYSGSQRVRFVGVQAPETTTPECGGAEAKALLKTLTPDGSPIQLRAQKGTSYDTTDGRARLVRSVYTQDDEGNWYDVSRRLMESGRTVWFPFADSGEQPEWAHNLEYRVLAQDAQEERRGLWAGDTCGGWRGDLNIRMWAKYWGTERVYIENNGPSDIDLSGWIVRDSAIKGYRTLAPGTVIPRGQAREVYAGDMNLNNLPADNVAFEGDAVYLMEPAGRYATGNLRAWFPYPCNPDDCSDPLESAVTMSAPDLDGQPVRAPSDPGSVRAVASTTAVGTATVTWAAPADLGGPSVTYTVTTSSPDAGAAIPDAVAAPAESATIEGLTPGKRYRFAVRALSGDGSFQSGSVLSDPAVVAAGLPGAPGGIVLEPRDGRLIASWSVPTTGATDADALVYTATATAGGTTAGTCSVSGATSCSIGGLLNGTAYTVTVRATNSVGEGSPSAASSPTAPALAAVAPATTPGKPGKPTSVTAMAGNSTIVASWSRPSQDGGAPITSYTATASPGGASCTAVEGITSCVIPGLANGTAYSVSVVASNGVASDPSNASPAATPFAYPRASATTAAPPAADPWVGGQYVDLVNTSGSTVRLGGYGLWDAQSSRYNNGGKLENRAAFLFDPNQELAPGGTLRVHFLDGTAPAATSSTLQRVFAGSALALATDGDFVELGSLDGAQVACRSRNGTSCAKAKPQSAPTQPVGVTARTTPTSVTVTWGAPISRGGLAIGGYTATAYDAQVGGTPIGSCSTDGSGRSCSFPGSIGTRYWVEVMAANAAGSSGPSWRVLAAPRTVPSTPGPVTVSGTPGGVKVSWTPAAENGAMITKYTASAYRAGTGGSPVGSCTTSSGAVLGCTITGLAGGTTYYIDVAATNRAGTGAPSSPRVTGAPGPGAAITTYERGRVVVRWDHADPGSGITGYQAKVYTKASGGKLLATCSAPGGGTSCTTKKLKKRSKYYVDLITQTAAGSFVMKPRIVTGPARKASAPKVTSATPSGRSVVIAWAPPSFNGYSYLKGYGARLYSKSKGGSVKASCSATPSTFACVTKSVKKGTYYAAARVKNSKGWSSWSKRVKVVVR